VAQCKIEDALFFKYGIEDPTIYSKALLHYDLLKESGGLSRDALVLANNVI
jgi:hypothetical protein